MTAWKVILQEDKLLACHFGGQQCCDGLEGHLPRCSPVGMLAERPYGAGSFQGPDKLNTRPRSTP